MTASFAEAPAGGCQGGSSCGTFVIFVDILAVRFPHPAPAHSRRVSSPLDVFLGVDPALHVLEEGVDVIHTMVLEHCWRFIEEKLHRAGAILTGSHFKDPILGFLTLHDKIAHRSGQPV